MVNFRIPSSVCCWEEGWRIQVGAQGYIEHCLGQIFEICKREFPTQWPHGYMEFSTLLSPRESTVWLFYHAVFSRSAREFPTQWRLGNCEFLTLLSPPRESTVRHFYHAVFSRSAREFPTQWRLGNSEFLPCSSQTKLIVWLFTMQYCSDLQRRSPQWRLGNSELFTLLSPLESTVRHFYHAEFSRSAREFHTVCSRE